MQCLHSKEQIERLAKLMREEGVRQPIHISNQTKTICFGHGRRDAALLNKWTKFPVVFQDFKDKEEEYRCVQSDNAIGSWSELDLAQINLDLKDLGPFDIDLLGIKDFTVDFSEKIIPGCGDEDEVPEVLEELKTKLGDIYILGNHRLMCGDSTSIDKVEKLMNGQKADMVFTDPPYGMKLDADFSSATPSLKIKGGNKYRNVIGDHEDFSPELINTVFGNFMDTPEIFMWGADYYAEHLVSKNEGSWIVWDKRLDESADKMYGSGFELCWSKGRHKRDIARVKWAGVFGTEQEFDRKRHHPTQKPILLAEWFFERWGKESKNVVDLFGGSGSTLIACEKTHRKCFMMELDPYYCDVIVARWEKYTGKKADLVEYG
jgi:DNA modification methylase